MAVTNSGDPINTLRSALDAYTTAQEAIISAAKDLKPTAPPVEPPTDITREGGAGSVISSRY